MRRTVTVHIWDADIEVDVDDPDHGEWHEKQIRIPNGSTIHVLQSCSAGGWAAYDQLMDAVDAALEEEG